MCACGCSLIWIPCVFLCGPYSFGTNVAKRISSRKLPCKEYRRFTLLMPSSKSSATTPTLYVDIQLHPAMVRLQVSASTGNLHQPCTQRSVETLTVNHRIQVTKLPGYKSQSSQVTRHKAHRIQVTKLTKLTGYKDTRHKAHRIQVTKLTGYKAQSSQDTSHKVTQDTSHKLTGYQSQGSQDASHKAHKMQVTKLTGYESQSHTGYESQSHTGYKSQSSQDTSPS